MTILPTRTGKRQQPSPERAERLKRLAEDRDATTDRLDLIHRVILRELQEGYAEGISRHQLAVLLGRDEATIRGYERRAGMKSEVS